MVVDGEKIEGKVLVLLWISTRKTTVKILLDLGLLTLALTVVLTAGHCERMDCMETGAVVRQVNIIPSVRKDFVCSYKLLQRDFQRSPCEDILAVLGCKVSKSA